MFCKVTLSTSVCLLTSTPEQVILLEFNIQLHSEWAEKESTSHSNASAGYFAGLSNHQVALLLCCYLVTRYSVLLLILVWRNEWYTKYAGMASTHLLRGPVGQLTALVFCRHKGRDWFWVAFVSGTNGCPFLLLFQFLLTFTLRHSSSHFLFLLKVLLFQKRKSHILAGVYGGIM